MRLDAKTVKNRVHLDLQPRDRTREQEVERLRDLGATVVDDRRQSDGSGWVVMADLEGNEFCVERRAVERGELDDELVAEVMHRYGCRTKREAVDLALRRLVPTPLTKDFLLGLRGIGFGVDLDELRGAPGTALVEPL